MTKPFKPMLAADVDISKLSFPCIAQPKIDGVRALNVNGKLTGRSLKPFKNKSVAELFSKEILSGFDGEMVASSIFFESPKDTCRETTSRLNTIEAGSKDILWIIYDDFSNPELPYSQRLMNSFERIQQLHLAYPFLQNHIQSIIDYSPTLDNYHHHNLDKNLSVITNLEELEIYNKHYLKKDMEGTILRSPTAPYKFGRSTIKEGGLLRLKEFQDAEAIVVSINEGFTNNNPATINELGLTERSSHKENKTPNGKVGSFVCIALEDENKPNPETFIVGAGKLTDEEKVYYFQNQSEIIGQIIKYQFFPTGIKDKPRFPTFQSIRAREDISK